MSLMLAGVVQFGLIAIFVMSLTKRGRSMLKRMWSGPYKETNTDDKLRLAVLKFAERTAAHQQPDRVDMPSLNRQLDAHVTALGLLVEMTEAKHAYFREVAWTHLMQCMKDTENVGQGQRGQVRPMRR